MKLEKYLDTYYFYSGKASDIARQLAFAGIAIIWIFKNGESQTNILPSELRLPTVLIVLGLSCDLLQYISGTLIWRIFHSIKEKHHTSTDDILASKILNKPIEIFFWAKICLIAFGYFLIFKFLIKKI